MRYKDRLTEITACGMRKQSGTSNNGDKWKHLKVIQTTPEQRTGKARNQGNKKTAILGSAHILRKVTLLTYLLHGAESFLRS